VSAAQPTRIDASLSIRDHELFVEDVSARSLAERFGTPLYVVSEDQLRRNAHAYARAFGQRWPGEFMLLPSLKANASLALRSILNQEGAGCDVFGPGELEIALGTGADADGISLNGPMKDEALLERAIRAGVRITVDSVAELERAREVAARLGVRAMVRLRFRPDLVGRDEPSEMSPAGLSVRGALDRYKAGIPTEDILALSEEEVRDPALDLRGVHLHVGRHSADPGVWDAAVASLADLLVDLRSRWGGWTPRELDVGGGYPAPRDPFGRLDPKRAQAPEHAPPIDLYAETLCESLTGALGRIEVAPASVRLEVEPGRGLYADVGVHLATVGNVKRQREPTELTWVETDSSDAYLPDVNLELNRWTCVAVGAADVPASVTADVTGRTCALDVIVPDAALPPVRRGDVLAFLDTGAYQEAGASNFNALPRPGTVLVQGSGSELVRRHETLADVFARDLTPQRLRRDGDGDGWRPAAIDHVSITCADLDASLDFYTGLLGIELRGRGEAQGGEFAITGIEDPRVRWADLMLDDGRVLELIEFVEPRGTPHRPQPNDAGATHVSLRVGDALAVHKRLRQAGAEPRSEPVTIEAPGDWNGSRAFYVGDPDGVTVELIERPGQA
jgi:diaminopimelate decarboxylase